MVGYDEDKVVVIKDSFIAGIIGGIFTRVIVTPLDVLKIRFQLQPEIGLQQRKYNGLLQAARTIFKEEGITAFWKGHIPAQCLSMIYGGMQFGTFQYFTEFAHRKYPHSKNDHVERAAVHCICGSVSGIIATVTAHPVDVLRTRFAAQREPKIYRSLSGAALHMYEREGWRAFYRGLAPSVVQVIPYAGLQFASYSLLHGAWRHLRLHEGSLSNILCGAGAGIMSKSIVYPLDVTKKRLQVQGFNEATVSAVINYKGFLNCMKVILRTEGLLGFYKGWSAAVLKSCATSGLVFFTYELISDFLRERKLRRPQ